MMNRALPTRGREAGSVAAFLSLPLVEQNRASRTAAFLAGGETTAATMYAGLSIGDVLYDALRVDPEVIHAADFVRVAEIGDVVSFSLFAEHLLSLPTAGLEGNLHQIKGYVFERLAAQQLQSMGMEVEFPESASNPGFDLLVNGEQFQVKCLESQSGVLEHFEKYPDVPILVNEELGTALAGHPLVYPVDGISEASVEALTRQSFDAAADVLDFDIPAVSSAVALGRNAIGVLAGNTDVRHGALNAVTDVVGGVLGGKAGSVVLASAGALLGPYGLVVGGLAGAIAGSSGGRRIAGRIRSRFGTRKARAEVEEAVFVLCCAGSEARASSEGIFRAKTDKLVAGARRTPLEGFIEARVRSELVEFGRSRAALNAMKDSPSTLLAVESPLSFVVSRLTQVKVHPHSVREPLDGLVDALRRLAQRSRMLA